MSALELVQAASRNLTATTANWQEQCLFDCYQNLQLAIVTIGTEKLSHAEAVAAARVQAFREAAKYLLAHHGNGIYECAEDIEAMK